MGQEFVVASPAEWLTLPEISCPSIASSDVRGSEYLVWKVGFAAATKDQCEEAGIDAEVGPADKCILPTVVIAFPNTKRLCRLPLELAQWAFDCVAMVRAGALEFPSKIEFYMLNGRPYAEFL